MTASTTGDPFLRDLRDALPTTGIWPPGVVVGVSGGADSMALLVGLAALAADRPRASLVVAHAEHDLRSEAAADRDFVAAVAGDLGLPFVSRLLRVRSGDGIRGEGIEARARRLRYRFLAEVAHDRGARYVAVAHTADDQAETILHRALRGTGLAGLAGMSTARQLCEGVALVRPLLGMSRSAVRGWLAARGRGWINDATNDDIRHARNFLRHEILARCHAGPYPDAAAALVRLAEHASRAAAAVASAADHLLEAHATRRSSGTVVIRAAALAALDPQLIADVAVALWRREGWPQRDMTARHYKSFAACIAAAAANGGPAAQDFPGGIHVRPGPERTLTAGPSHVVISTRR